MEKNNINSAAGNGAHVLGRTVLFSLGLVLIFTLIANLLPQVEGEAPIDLVVDLGSMTPKRFAALGESIFNAKGTCTLCHNNLGRAPDILEENMDTATADRLDDPRYQGEAHDIESYLRESMLSPSIYVVAGFGQKGSNDTISPMPVVNKAPINLSETEINAVIAFLESKDGGEVRVSLPAVAPERDEAQPATTQVNNRPEPAANMQEAVARYACAACHSMMDTQSPIAPDLRNIGSRLSKEQIRQSIIDPNAEVAEGYPAGMMPQDFAQRMTISELEMIVQFLASQTT